MKDSIYLAADVITQAKAILIGAGAGMGVDSGMPDFRGNEGFWRAYPPMQNLGLAFHDLANPKWFALDPELAWGFYGHRRNLYLETRPHDGFSTLKKWVDSKPQGGFVFTSNVDGHFQRARFSEERIVECHGSINYDQCYSACRHKIWRAAKDTFEVDPLTFRAVGDLPSCPQCRGLSRPNILMFGDTGWLDQRTTLQYSRYQDWLSKIEIGPLAIIEFGAGTSVPTVRIQCQQQSRRFNVNLIRVNPREADGAGVISISAGALAAINQIDRLIEND